jgi:hypothetical protein
VLLAGPLESAEAGLRSLYVSPRGSDKSLCTRSTPCRSFDRAYRLARPGQTVILRRGTYRSQVVHLYRSKRSTRDVLFRPARGAKVVVRGSLSVYGRHLEFRGLEVTGAWRAYSSARDLTFRSIATGSFLVAGTSALRVYGGSAGPAVDVSNFIQAGPLVPTSILIDGLTAAGFGRGAAGREVSCVEVRAVNGLTIRRSRSQIARIMRSASTST